MSASVTVAVWMCRVLLPWRRGKWGRRGKKPLCLAIAARGLSMRCTWTVEECIDVGGEEKTAVSSKSGVRHEVEKVDNDSKE